MRYTLPNTQLKEIDMEEITHQPVRVEENDEYRQHRMEHMEALKALGYAPYGKRFDRTGLIADLRASFEEGRTGIRAAGRVMALRDMGKTIFADLRDGTDHIQLFVNKNQLGEDAYKAFKLVDLGDHIGVVGEFFTTRTGEMTIRVQEWEMLSKALRQPPDKHSGLTDQEECYRRRYVDLFSNAESRAKTL